LESEARALLHEPLTDASSERARELYALSGQLTKANLQAMGKLLRVPQILVFEDTPCVQVQVFDVADSAFTARKLVPDGASTGACVEPSAQIRYTTLVHELEGDSSVSRRGSGTPFYASPWFWGGASAAALLGVIAYAVSSSSGSETARIRIEAPR
jgi:hypothetical protein